MISLKKLITAFLVLAVIASSSALIFSNLETSGSSSSLELSPDETTKATVSVIGENAFQEPIPVAPFLTNNTVNEPSLGATFNNTGNLTEELAQELALGFIEANPEGPSDFNGEQSLTPPDLDALIEKINLDPQKIENLMAEKWPTEVADTNIKIIISYTGDDLARYSDSFYKIIEENFLNSNIDDSLTQEVSAEALSAAALVVENAALNAERLEVPKPLLDFHKSFLVLLNHERNALALANKQEDPLKTALLLNLEEKNFDKAVDDFTSEFLNLKSLTLDFKSKSSLNPLAAIGSLFTTQRAHALFGIGETAILAAVLKVLKTIWNLLKKAALEILKNQLVHRMVAQIINWANGGGQPQFITNWREFLRNAADAGAGAAIEKIIPGLCEPFQPLVQLSLQSIQDIAVTETKCTLSQVVQNITSFYNNFLDRGVRLGWASYGSLIRFENNFYGASILAHDEVVRQAAAAGEAAQSEGESSGGFLSTKMCPTNYVLLADGRRCALPGSYPIKYADPILTTPGGAIGDTVATALSAPLHRIVNATDIAALVSSLIDSALNKLILIGVRGLLGLTGTGAVAPGTNYQELVIQESYAILASKETALDLYNQLITISSSTIDILRQALAACFSNGRITDLLKINDALNAAIAEYNQLVQQRNALISQLTSLRTFINTIQNAPASANFQQYLNQLHQQFGTEADAENLINTLSQKFIDFNIQNGNAQDMLARCNA